MLSKKGTKNAASFEKDLKDNFGYVFVF